MADYREVTACRLCGSTELASALDLGETPLANELDGTELFPLKVNRCGSCGHHQLSIAVKPERLWGPSYPYQSGTSPVFRKHLEALADEVAALKPGGVVLEIAANDGTLIRELKGRELQAYGIDPCGDGKDVLAASWPYEQTAYAWPNQPFMNGKTADVVLALNVFAHVDDLHSFTAAVKEALAPDGVFIVEVGEPRYFDTVYHEHMSYHDEASFTTFLARHGLKVTRVERNDSQGGSMRFYAEHAASLGLDIDEQLHDRDAALREAFRKLEIRGERIAIYGAPAKLTTLLYATGLNEFKFDCVGEDNPRKVGRTTPGMHIPIVTVQEMLERRPDTVVIAAWNFFDDLRDKLRRLGFSGGIINPMGRVE